MALSVEEITQTLFDAVDTIVSSRVAKDRDLLEKATIVDASDHGHGRYVVYNGSAKYVATCSNTELIKGLQVLVLIEDGDFSKEKVIIERCISTEENAALLESPLSRCELSNDELIKTQPDVILLYLNKSDESQEEKEEESDNPNSKKKKTNKEVNLELNEIVNGDVSVQGNQYIGISADFRAALNNLGIIKGDYGIIVEIEYKDEKEGTTYKKLYPLSAKGEMIGDIYNFTSFFPQAALYALDLNKTIIGMRAYAYQDGTFGSTYSDMTDDEIQHGAIEIKNISIKFGKDKSALSEVDDIKLVCNNSLFYDATESDSVNQKTINLKWQFSDKNNSKYFDINNMSDFKEAIGLDAYKIYWYRATPKTIDDQLNDFDKQALYYVNLDKYIAEYLQYYEDNINKVNSERITTEIAKKFNEYYVNLLEPLGEGSFTSYTLSNEDSNGIVYTVITPAGIDAARNIQKQKDIWVQEKRDELEYALLLGGQNWEYIQNGTDKFTLAGFVPRSSMEQDSVKVIIEYGLVDKDGKILTNNTRYKVKYTDPLKFNNVSYAYLAEKQKNFTIIPEDGSGGSYYIYSSDDSLLADRGDAAKKRSMAISFFDDKKDLINAQDIVIWKLPKSNTMLNFEGTIGGPTDNPSKFGKILTLDELNKILLDNGVEKDHKAINSSYFLNSNESFDDFYFVQRNLLVNKDGKITGSIGCDFTEQYDETGKNIQKEIKQLDQQYAQEVANNKKLKGNVNTGAKKSNEVTTTAATKPDQKTTTDGTWKKEGGFWYYVLKGTTINATEWQCIKWSNKPCWFYFNKDGKMLTGWQKLLKSNKTSWFYFDENGVMLTGWQKLQWKGEKHWFYFDINGAMLTGWQELDWSKGKNWFYFNSNGFMLTGWQQLKWSGGTSWFYFNADGSMATGWQNIEYNKVKDWYYFDAVTGAMKANTTIDGANLTFSKNGDLIKIEYLTDAQRLKVSDAKLQELSNKKKQKEAELVKHILTSDEDRLKALKTQKYYIQSFYNSNFSNNTVKCYIIKKNNELSETVLRFLFGQQTLMVSDYNFVIRFGGLVDKDFNTISDTKPDVALTLPESNDDMNEYQEIIFSVYGPDNKEIDLTNQKIHDIIKLWVDGSEDGYFSGYDKKDNLKFIKKTKTVKENGEDKTYYSRVAVTPVWKDSISIKDFANIVLQARYISNDESVDLIQLFPLHFRKAYVDNNIEYKQHYLLGSEFVIYNMFGTNPKYCETFKIINYNNNREINGKIHFSDENFTNFIDIEDKMKIKPKTVYDKDKKSSGVIFTRIKGNTETDVYTFPLVAIQNKYQIALIDNRTPASSTTLTENSEVVNSVMTSGSTNSNNTFTGMVIGSVSNNNSTLPTATSSGLFGYQNGTPFYGFSDDGIAFIGRESEIDRNGNVIKNNGGNIHWNDAGGIIKSGDPNHGLLIDLADGSVTAKGDFNLIGSVSQKVRNSAPVAGAGSKIQFSGNGSTVELGLWYYPNEKLTAPFVNITDGKNSLVFDKDNFYIQNQTAIGNTTKVNTIDLKKGEINFNNNFVVDSQGVVRCGQLTGTFVDGQLNSTLKLYGLNTKHNINSIGTLVSAVDDLITTTNSLKNDVITITNSTTLNVGNLIVGGNVTLNKNATLQIGNTVLNETQLQNLLALIS